MHQYLQAIICPFAFRPYTYLRKSGKYPIRTLGDDTFLAPIFRFFMSILNAPLASKYLTQLLALYKQHSPAGLPAGECFLAICYALFVCLVSKHIADSRMYAPATHFIARFVAA